MFANGISFAHWFILGACIVWGIAWGFLLKRLGYSAAWGIVFAFPIASFFGIWFLLAMQWPVEEPYADVAQVFEPDLREGRKIRRGA